MSVHIDQLTSEVLPEPESSTSGEGGGDRWEELDRVWQAHSRLIRDLVRTSAEGFDD